MKYKKRKFDSVCLVMNLKSDQVAIAKEDIASGSILIHEGRTVKIKKDIKKGHRLAMKEIPKGEYVRQYGHPFGCSKGIQSGEPITIANIKNVLPRQNLKDFKKPAQTRYQKDLVKKAFAGYVRKNGAVGTRNYYLIVPTSMCASETALQVALTLQADKRISKKHSSFDGIVAIPHTEGCGCDSGLSIERLLRVLKTYIAHPNVGGCLIMDLGCEQTNYEKVHPYLKKLVSQKIKPIDWVSIEESGGITAARKKAETLIRKRLPQVIRQKRQACSLGKLIVGTECGASDTFSGITANPLIGYAVDQIIYAKGSAILSEIPEMVGTFDMLWPRFRSLKAARKFQKIMSWYVTLAKKLGTTLEANLVPKNVEVGLINNYIKSLGAVIKGGTTVIEDVLEYAEPLTKRGLHIMQGPGNDLESVTGIVASGANLVCFSTGQGTPTGSAICPVIKIASTNSIFKKLSKDIDFNAGQLLQTKPNLETLGCELLSLMIKVASGQKTCSEKLGQRQFQIWTAGKLPL
ncbi:MAG: altronate dehydratase [Candidatus Omnitrophota bacterium]